MNPNFQLNCVLFDLDGTLADTAPDLLSCLNHALEQHGLHSVAAEHVRPYISYGAAAMIKASVNTTLSKQQLEALLNTMLDLYQANIAEHTKLFTGLSDILNWLEQHSLKWGIVTNKRARFTVPLMSALQLDKRAACMISGDTANRAKPHPEPMLAACRQAAVNPQHCVYIGDAEHDVLAGKSVGMKTLVALYGYLKPDDRPETWAADGLIATPQQLSTWLSSTLCY